MASRSFVSTLLLLTFFGGSALAGAPTNPAMVDTIRAREATWKVDISTDHTFNQWPSQFYHDFGTKPPASYTAAQAETMLAQDYDLYVHGGELNWAIDDDFAPVLDVPGEIHFISVSVAAYDSTWIHGNDDLQYEKTLNSLLLGNGAKTIPNDNLLHRNPTWIWLNPVQASENQYTYNRGLWERQLDAYAQGFWNLGEGRVDGFFTDYAPLKPWHGTTPSASDTDLDGDGVAWEAEESTAWRDMFRDMPHMLRDKFGDELIVITNGDMVLSDQVYAASVNGICYEGWPTYVFGNIDHHAAIDTLYATYQWPTPIHGRRWNVLTDAGDDTPFPNVAAGVRHSQRVAEALSSLFDLSYSSCVGYGGGCDSLGNDDVNQSFLGSRLINPGTPTGAVARNYVAHGDSSYVRWTRPFDDGVVRLLINIDSGWVVPDSVAFDPN